jgi:hypothetical protein
MHLHRTLGALLLVVILGAGCAQTDPSAPDQRESAGTSAADGATTEGPGSSGESDGTSLRIEVQNSLGAWSTSTLTCDPDGGTHPTPRLACLTLESAVPPFPAPGVGLPDDDACTPLPSTEKAVISGTWKGRQVAVKYDQTTTCARQRWASLAVVLIPEYTADGLSSVEESPSRR